MIGILLISLMGCGLVFFCLRYAYEFYQYNKGVCRGCGKPWGTVSETPVRDLQVCIKCRRKLYLFFVSSEHLEI